MSSLQKAVQDYLSLRRKLGYKLYEPGLHLADFVSFLERQRASHITTELALRWAMQPADAQPSHWAARLRSVRLFAEHHRGSDPRTEVPPRDLLPYRPRRAHPYIYNAEEIRDLLEAAKELSSKTGLRPWTYYTLFGLLTVTGLRISEALALNQADVALNDGVLTVRKTKFQKTRLVPIHPSTVAALRNYSTRRDGTFPSPLTPAFFVSERGNRLGASVVHPTFNRLSMQIGLRRTGARSGPRLHDLRHRFAVETLLRWYRADFDVDVHIPALSTYLGHSHVNDTYWYLSSVPELLRLATERLERRTEA